MLKTLRTSDSPFTGFIIWCVVYAFFLNVLSASFFTYAPPMPQTQGPSLAEMILGIFVSEAQADTDQVVATVSPGDAEFTSGIELANTTNSGESGTGAAGGAGSVNSVMGAYSYGYPLAVPEGRGGMTPALSLAYSSLGGGSWFGHGWNLAIGSIERKTKLCTPAYTDDDTFVITLKGIAITLVKEDNEYRLKDEGLFLRIFKEGDSWRAQEKSGTVYYFGRSDNSRLAGAGGTFRWRLDRMQDADGNYMTFTYFKDSANGGALYPERIDYAGHTGGDAPTYSVLFHKELRPDPSISYLTGTKVTTAYRIMTVEVRFDETELIRAYKLTYNSESLDPPLATSYLQQIQQFGSDARFDDADPAQDRRITGGTSLPPTTFDYTNHIANDITPREIVYSDTKINGNAPVSWDNNIWQGDYNGDGRTDLFVTENCCSSSEGWWLYFSKDSSFEYVGGGGEQRLHGYKFDKYTRVYPGDYNGDGKTDIVVQKNYREISPILLFYTKKEGVGFEAPIAINPQGGSGVDAIYTGDFNGDGRQDLIIRSLVIRTYSCDTNPDATPGTGICKEVASDQGQLYLATESGMQYTGNVPMHKTDYLYYNSHRTFHFHPVFADFNGDGRTDMLWPKRPHYETTTDVHGLYLSNGRGLVLEKRSTFGMSTDPDDRLTVGDFNGDGRTDILTTDGGYDGYKLYLSKGDGLAFARHGNWPSHKEHIHTGDFNGDGRSDMVVTSKGGFRFYLSTGDNFVQTQTGSWPTRGERFNNGDFNGDGITDMLITGNDAYDHKWDGCKLYLNHSDFQAEPVAQTMPRLLGRVTNSMGAVTEIIYTPSTTWQDDTDVMPMSIPTVKTITTSDGIEGGQTSAYSYTYDAPFYDIGTKEFRGFRTVTVKDHNAGLTSVTEFHQADSRFQGRIMHNWSYDKNGVLSVQTDNTWKGMEYATTGKDPRTYVYLESSTVTHFDEQGQVQSTIQSKYSYDPYGNMTVEDKTVHNADTGEDARQYTRTEYDYHHDQWIMGKPLNVRVDTADPGPTGAEALRETRYAYDPVKPWQLAKETRVLWGETGETEISVEYSYDIYGHVTRTTSPRNPQWAATIDYTDPGQIPGLFAYRSTNAVGHTIHKVYDPRFGVATEETDPNGQTSSSTYDELGRPTTVTFPDGSTKTHTYNIEPGNHWIGVSATGMPDAVTFYDNLDRAVKARVTAAGETIDTDTIYNDEGKVWKQSLPYRPGDAIQYTTFAYDQRGRRVLQVNPDQTRRTTVYNRFRTTTTDENGIEHTAIKDSLGRLSRVVEPSGGVTDYAYDLFGNLIWIKGPLGNQTHIYYDSLGRKISMDDPYMGHWEYRYDACGNLTWQQDGQGHIVEMAYDPIDRILEKDYLYTQRFVAYTYGEPRQGYFNATALTTLTTTQPGRDENIITYDCDYMGRAVHETRTINNTTYHIHRNYDQSGRLQNVVYPNNSLETAYTYDPMGRLQRVEQINPDATKATLATYSDYNALGQIGTLTYGNGAITTYAYNPDHHRLEALRTRAEKAGTFQDIQNLAYTFDNVGNIKTISDSANNVSYDFDYDNLNRLATARAVCPSDPSRSYDQAYVYDLAGNMTAKTGKGGFEILSWQGGDKHTRPDTVVYDGDAAGVGRRQVVYDQDNKPVTMTYKGSESHLFYDGNGSRYKKTHNGQSTLYVGSLYELRDGQVHLNIYAGGKRLATVRAGHTYYSHGDHLGSTALVTDDNGRLVEEIGYLPFGATLYRTAYEGGVWKSAYRFTGQEYDAEYELYNYNARLYDPTLGRFITADTVVPDWTDPQTLNRYSYCRNNPLAYTDPTGHELTALCLFVYTVITSMIIGGISAALQGGNVFQGIVMGAITGIISGGLFYGAGQIIAGKTALCAEITGTVAKSAIHVATGAVSGAINAAITGGDIGQNALISAVSAGIGKGVTSLSKNPDPVYVIGSGALTGGVTSMIFGGDFAEGAYSGAWTSAIAFVCNHEISKRMRNYKLKPSQQYLKNKNLKTTQIDLKPAKGGEVNLLPEGWKTKGINNVTEPVQQSQSDAANIKRARTAINIIRWMKAITDIFTGGGGGAANMTPMFGITVPEIYDPNFDYRKPYHRDNM